MTQCDTRLSLSSKNLAAATLLATAAIAGSDRATAQSYYPFTLSNGTLTIACTAGDDDVRVQNHYSGYLLAVRGNYSRSFAASSVQRIRCFGGDGDDRIRNLTAIPCEFDGGNGDDYLVGGSGPDHLVGGYGQDAIVGGDGDDTLLGSGGSDSLDGQGGNDVIRGHGGNDFIRGGNGRDEIFPGSGNDTVYGDGGQDLIVTVGGGSDTIRGGYQWDNYWIDSSDQILDASALEHSRGYVHVIANFEQLKRPGASFQPGIEPNGVDLLDPLPLGAHSVLLTNQSHRPLFGPYGPAASDVNQGAVGDCYFLAMLSAVADQQPEEIRKLVTSLGDGTYAVRFFRDGQPRYVRVDGQMWTFATGANAGTQAYARPGGTGANWAMVVEKAFAFFRKEAGTYGSIAGGNTSWPHHTIQVGATMETYSLPQSPSRDAIVAWHQGGRSNYFTTWMIRSRSNQLLGWIDTQLQAGRSLTTGSVPGVSDSTAIVADNYRRGTHQYHVLAVGRDSQGNPDELILRDPYGPLRRITDPARIVFLIGGAATADF